MPEGDSLVRLAHRLRPVLAGHRLIRTDFRVPRLATLDLAGRTVEAVRSRAKYLLMDVGEVTVLSHLRMEGRWISHPLTGPDGGSRRPRWSRPAWQARCVLETSGHQVVGFQLGLLEVLPTAEVEARLQFLGPDLLGADWDDPGRVGEPGGLLEESVRRLRQAPDRPIGLALLDQRLVSGLGNIYRCESLLLAGLDPHRPVSSVPDLPGLVLLARDLMLANIPPQAPLTGARRTTTGVRPDPSRPYGVRVEFPGAVAAGSGGAPGGRGRRSGRAAASPSSSPPASSYWVYRRERQGCLRCGGAVILEEFGEVPGGIDGAEHADGLDGARQLWWCPHCQR